MKKKLNNQNKFEKIMKQLFENCKYKRKKFKIY